MNVVNEFTFRPSVFLKWAFGTKMHTYSRLVKLCTDSAAQLVGRRDAAGRCCFEITWLARQKATNTGLWCFPPVPNCRRMLCFV